MKKEFVVLVNERGKRTGLAEKLKAHQQGLLHRAFSIFLFNEKGEMLLQQRAKGKYHFAGLWSNACCSHPREGERVLSAAKRRLMEELGIESPLKDSGHVLYKFHDDKSTLTEHEYDYIFTGKSAGKISFNKKEVAAVRWMSRTDLKREIKSHPGTFTPWFKEILKQIKW